MSDEAVRQRWPELVSVLAGAGSDFGNDAAKELEASLLGPSHASRLLESTHSGLGAFAVAVAGL